MLHSIRQGFRIVAQSSKPAGHQAKMSKQTIWMNKRKINVHIHLANSEKWWTNIWKKQWHRETKKKCCIRRKIDSNISYEFTITFIQQWYYGCSIFIAAQSSACARSYTRSSLSLSLFFRFFTCVFLMYFLCHLKKPL